MCGGGSVASLCARGRRDEPWQIFVRFRNQVFPEFTGVSLPELCGEVDAGVFLACAGVSPGVYNR